MDDALRERINLSLGRIRFIKKDAYSARFKAFFNEVADFIIYAYETIPKIKNDESLSFSDLYDINQELYDDILPDNYITSFANPDYAVEFLGEDFGRILSFLYYEIRGIIPYLYEERYEEFIAVVELFLEVYNIFLDPQMISYKYIRDAIYYHMYDYTDVMVERRTLETISPEFTFATDIIMNSDLSDLRYLFKYGEYISENETKTAEYLNKLSQKEIDDMAETYVNGFINGFKSMGIDLSPKRTVNIRYSIGQERMVRSAVKMFEEHNLKPIIFRYATSRINRRLTLRTGYISTFANQQYEYDHRMDEAVFTDKAILERKLEVIEDTYKKHEKLAKEYAGPAVIETFGEAPFKPVIKDKSIKLNDKQQKYMLDYQTKAANITNKYIPRDKYSFTIIAYPVPEIGDNFEEIFAEIVKVNTLDNALYEEIQEHIINELNNAEYVHVKGTGNNKTDIKVMMHKITDFDRETNFENCLADVNIPLGEVFTSPKLTGTEGVLNVSEVYLNELKYINLNLTFKDGKISEYTCDNFKKEEENKAYIKENLMFNHDTLPIGEFAIGTNTVAYVMARRFNILRRLPILIVEKMGPHFAVGDTCYSYSEDMKLYNPDGREIVAKDNECSVLRLSKNKEEREKAYFNCHTDITIPYEEIGSIASVHPDGKEVLIIENGRFVLPGTEKLNEAFE